MARHSGDGRDPCPDRIISDVGGGFAMGALGGSVYHYILGSRGAMKGRRLASGLERIRMNAPVTAGGFAVWAGFYSMCDCSLVYIRQKEDPWNSIAAGACTSGLLAFRSGPRVVAASALFGGFVVGMIEGLVILSSRIESIIPQQEAKKEEPVVVSPQSWNIPNPLFPATVPVPELISENSAGKSSSSSWYGGLFSWGKTHKKNDESILESFDAPAPPVFYDYK